MNKENRYLVIKRSDLQMAENILKPEAFEALETLEKYSNQVRINRGKPPLVCVVVEQDWPMYDDTWKSIEQYVDTGEYTRTNTDLEEAQAQVRTLTEALTGIVDEAIDYERRNGALKGALAEWIEKAKQALSSPPIATYQAERAVIEAAKEWRNFESCGLSSEKSEENLVKSLQELERSNEGDES